MKTPSAEARGSPARWEATDRLPLKRRAFVILTLVGIIVLFQAGPSILGIDAASIRWWADPAFLLVTLATTMACFFAARASSGSDVRAWRLIAYGHLCWFVAMAVWTYFELLADVVTPFPALSDLFWVAVPPMFMLGIMAYRSGRAQPGSLLLHAINLGVVVCTFMIVVPLLLHEGLYAALATEEGLQLYHYTALAYPILYGSVFVFGLICFGFRVTSGKQAVIFLLLVSVGFHVAATYFYAEALLGYDYEIGADIDLLWIIAFAFACWAAFEQWQIARADAGAAETPPSESLRAAEMLIPALALAGIFMTDYYYNGLASADDFVIAVAAKWAFAFFFGLRAWWALRVETGLRHESERAGRRLAASQERLRSLFEHTQDAMLLVAADGSVLSSNPVAAKMFGRPHDKIVGSALRDLVPEFAMSDADAPGSARREVMLNRGDGRTRWLEIASARFRNESEEELVSLIISDITWRKHSEAALLRATLDSISQGVAVFGEDLQLAAANEAFGRLLDLPPALTQIGTAYADLVRFRARRGEFGQLDPETLVAARIDRVRAAIIGAEDCDMPGGVSLEERVNPMADRGFVVTYTDITERKRIERMKSEFVSTVSHELRTPLTSMAGSLGLIVGGAAGEVPKPLLPLLEIAHKNCDRLQRLINDILDIEKIESGKLDFEMRPLALPLLVEQAIEANTSYAASHGVSIELAGPPPQVTVTGDLNRLLQVMANLLSNAAKFSAPGGTVRVAAEVHEGNARISVVDQGSGIPEEFRARIFERFAQADSSDARQKGGTGLGLSISKAIVETHGGQISYASEVGHGATFHVDLPVAALVVVPAPATASVAAAVLVSSGDPKTSASIRKEIEALGLEVVVAESVADTQSWLGGGKPFLAIAIDINMDDAFDLIRQRGSDSCLSALPIIAVASGGNNGNGGEIVDLVDWLIKPLDSASLRRAVEQIANDARSSLPRLLHVEDDLDNQHVVAVTLRDIAVVEAVTTIAGATSYLQQQSVDLVLLDLMLPDGVGTDLLPQLHDRLSKWPIPVVIYSAFDLPNDVCRQVAACLVKAQTSTERLRSVIRTLVGTSPRTEVSCPTALPRTLAHQAQSAAPGQA